MKDKLCKDCRHYEVLPFEDKLWDSLYDVREYSWIGKCEVLKSDVVIYALSENITWGDFGVMKVPASFGCILWEAKE